jgi:N-acetylmuramoyl-L-alanine amidase
MPILDRPSPNHSERREAPIDILLLHYTGMLSTDAALDRLCDPVAEVSSHYLIDEDGTIHRLVAEERRAFHAGVSFWAGTRDVNSRSIGIELVNPGHEWGYHPFPARQMAALAVLARVILARYPIPPHRVLGHSDVAPDRKQDPGELFEWRWLAERGIGIWPDPAPVPAVDPAAELARIGYETVAGVPVPAAIVTAFQRHWRPARVDGVLDRETLQRIAAVAALVPHDH